MRDISGLVQVVLKPELAKDVRPEWVVCIEGLVKARPERMVNPNFATGKIEIEPVELEILNELSKLPKDKLMLVPASKICQEKLGKEVVSSIYLLGYAVGKKIMPLKKESALRAIKNIIPETRLPALKLRLLTEEPEKKLHERLNATKAEVDSLLKEYRYADALRTLSGLTDTINNFFDNVLVMDKQDDIKFNRLALLRNAWAAASSIADFSKL